MHPRHQWRASHAPSDVAVALVAFDAKVVTRKAHRERRIPSTILLLLGSYGS